MLVSNVNNYLLAWFKFSLLPNFGHRTVGLDPICCPFRSRRNSRLGPRWFLRGLHLPLGRCWALPEGDRLRCWLHPAGGWLRCRLLPACLLRGFFDPAGNCVLIVTWTTRIGCINMSHKLQPFFAGCTHFLSWEWSKDSDLESGSSLCKQWAWYGTFKIETNLENVKINLKGRLPLSLDSLSVHKRLLLPVLDCWRCHGQWLQQVFFHKIFIWVCVKIIIEICNAYYNMQCILCMALLNKLVYLFMRLPFWWFLEGVIPATSCSSILQFSSDYKALDFNMCVQQKLSSI